MYVNVMRMSTLVYVSHTFCHMSLVVMCISVAVLGQVFIECFGFQRTTRKMARSQTRKLSSTFWPRRRCLETSSSSVSLILFIFQFFFCSMSYDKLYCIVLYDVHYFKTVAYNVVFTRYLPCGFVCKKVSLCVPSACIAMLHTHSLKFVL